MLARNSQDGRQLSGKQSLVPIRERAHSDSVYFSAVQGETQAMLSASCGYAIEVSQEMEDPEWDAFLKMTHGASYQQTSLWARTKSFGRFRPVRVVIKHTGTIVAGAQMLIRRVRGLGAIGYVTRGPVVTREHPASAALIIEVLHRFARKAGVRCLAVQTAANDRALAEHTLDWDLCPNSLTFAPVATLLVNLNQDLDTIMAAMRKTTRYDIRSSERKGVEVRVGTEDDLSTFHRLALITGERQGFSTEPLEYYRHAWHILAPGNHLKLFLAEVNGEAVSTALVIAFGDSVTFWRSGWSGSHAGYHPNEAVQWAAIKWAKVHGYPFYDLGGIGPRTAALLQRGEALPDAPDYRAYLFKIGFGGKVAVFPRASLYLYNPLLRMLYRTTCKTAISTPVVAQLMKLC